MPRIHGDAFRRFDRDTGLQNHDRCVCFRISSYITRMPVRMFTYIKELLYIRIHSEFIEIPWIFMKIHYILVIKANTRPCLWQVQCVPRVIPGMTLG